MLLFLDANVLFSAARNAEGRAAALFDLARSRYCALTASPHAIEEARRNLEIKHPELPRSLDQLLKTVVICPECSAQNAAWARAENLPDKDAPILGAAAQAGAQLLVTGDRTHFGHLYGRTLRGVLIATPAEALARLLALAPGRVPARQREARRHKAETLNYPPGLSVQLRCEHGESMDPGRGAGRGPGRRRRATGVHAGF